MGKVPLANAFVASDADDDDKSLEPLALVMCLACTMLQIREEVPREKLFRNYLWMTSTSTGARRHAEWLSSRLWERYGSREAARPFLVEIASNDGFFLQHYRDAGFDILGVDPSNFADEASARGLTSIRDFFGESVAERILASRSPADVIVARNVLGHSSELQDLVAGIKKLLAPAGVLVLELPYAYMLRAETQYDTIFHEHLSYLTVGSLHNLFARYGMKIIDVDFVDMNGGSLLCEIVHEEDPRPANDRSMLSFEQLIRLNSVSGWQRFAKDVQRQRESLLRMLRELKVQGKRVVAYGAAAKFMTMLNFCGIDSELVAACGDANDRKQGLLCPGVRIPVVSPQRLIAMEPDYVLIGAWNFRDEIVEYLTTAFGYRGEFILPLPVPEIVKC